MTHKGTQTLETKRLILRRFTMADVPAMYRNWASEDDVTKYLTWPTHTDQNVTQAVLADWIVQYDKNDFYNWAIELKGLNEVIGNISVVSYRAETLSANLGYSIGTRWWGQEIMPEAAAAVLKFLFEEVGFNRIAADHDSNNPKSGRVMQKIGMNRLPNNRYKESFYYKKHSKNECRGMPLTHYILTKEEYKKLT